MRHKVYGKHLGRTKNQRTALFKSLVQAIILSEKIETTEAKAKAVKGLIDKVINQAKSETTKRYVASFLTHKKTQERLFTELVPRLSSRNSGYTSTVRLGRRLGDGAMIVQMSLLLEEAKKATPKAVKEVEVKEVVETEAKPTKAKISTKTKE